MLPARGCGSCRRRRCTTPRERVGNLPNVRALTMLLLLAFFKGCQHCQPLSDRFGRVAKAVSGTLRHHPAAGRSFNVRCDLLNGVLVHVGPVTPSSSTSATTSWVRPWAILMALAS